MKDLFLYSLFFREVSEINFLKLFLMFYFIFETEREGVRVGEGQRERETESEAGSRLWAVSAEPDLGLEPMIYKIMTWAKVGCSLGRPLNFFIKKKPLVFKDVNKDM